MKFAVYFLVFANLVMAGWLFSHQDNYRVSSNLVEARSTSGEGLLLLSERVPLKPAPVPLPAPAAESVAEVAVVAPPVPADNTADSTQHGPVQLSQTLSTRVCHVLGPFTERQAVEGFAAKLSALGVTTHVRVTPTEEPSGYWVYLPSMPRADAQRIIAELKAKGVKDFFLGRQHFISLGVFTDKDTAEARVRTMTALGYSPTLEPRYLRRDIYWLDADEAGDKLIGAAEWLSLMGDHVGIKRQTLTCE